MLARFIHPGAGEVSDTLKLQPMMLPARAVVLNLTGVGNIDSRSLQPAWERDGWDDQRAICLLSFTLM